MKNSVYTITVKARETAVDSVVSRGKQMFQALTVPNARVDESRLAERFAAQLRVGVAEAQYFIDSLSGLIVKELQAGNQVDFPLVSFYPRLSGSLPAKDADPAGSGLYMQGCVRARRQLRDALKNCLKPVNVLSPGRVTIHDVLDVDLQRRCVVGIGHVIHIAGINVEIDPDAPDEGVWLESSGGKVLARAEVFDSDLQTVSCRFTDPVPPGKCSLVLGNRANSKGGNYSLLTRRFEIEVV